MNEDEKNSIHKEKMAKRKKFQDNLVKNADQTKKLLMVYTGTGKGKSTAAFGTILRALGHDYKVGVVQFIKGAWQTGEQKALEKFDNLIRYEVAGEGFTWNTQDRTRDIEKAREAWSIALEMLADDSYHLVLLDELNIVLRYDYLPHEEVLSALNKRKNHVIVTGRNAPQALIDLADLATEMKMIKHPFREQGIKAQAGIEF
ncbi:MAG: cob(I)yrinic acid a,c-diamide adenosyltransferase [Rickettsiales bacterium]|jgi:cob(I)alamin adenosyltransferase